ncbi:MAG TPA: fused MFS/spermidine synthase [Bryobacteraceae bacterium]|nr:fused MFS/spermidine synthase [Bryobacteraceae bacterium]
MMYLTTGSAMSHLHRRFPLLLLLFAASGCSALIYEIVWYHLLQLEIGSTAVSIGVLLATFMGGLCLGSIGLPRLRLSVHPLRLYAVLEAGIAACGLLVLVLMPLVGGAYLAVAEHGIENMLLRGLLAAICMLPPTILMGASLPAISRWLETTPEGTARLGWLYGANTGGAVLGCLAAGFYLLRLYNVYTASFAAAALNLAVAAVSWWITREAPAFEDAVPLSKPQTSAGSRAPAVYVAIALSGAGALGAEVVWTRLMGMLLGSTVYVFSIILAVFLIGLAAGSAAGASLARSLSDPRRVRLALGWCQILVAAGVAWTAIMISDSLPYWPIDPTLSPSNWFIFQLDMARCLWAILPPTLLWGASFPLALAAAAQPGEDPAHLVGGIYAANTVGAIAGALAVSLALVPWIGSQDTQRLLLVLSAAGGWVLLVPRWREKQVAAALAASLVLAALAAPRIHPIPPEVIAFGRRIATNAGKAQILHVAEGRNSSVVISRWEDGATQIDVNGHVEATNEPFDMKLQRMVGHLAALTHPNPHKVLGIGFGAGVSAGTFTRYPGIRSITVCEIEPVIPPISTRFFGREDYNVLHDPRTRIVYDDARHYLLTTSEKYDIIASDPLDVFVKGTAALYSKEYFQAVKAHLNPGGAFTLYVPLYESDVRTVKSELATFFEAFPDSTIWANTLDGQGYDMVFMGHLSPPRIDVDETEARLRKAEFAPVLESLRDIGVNSAVDLFSTYMGSNADFATWVKGADINLDRDLRLQYLGGWGINSNLADPIYREMLASRRLSSHPFTGSPERVQALLGFAGAPGLR